MMDASRFAEAAARLYLSTVLEPNFIPGRFAVTSAQFIRDCSMSNCDGDGWNFDPSALSDWQKETLTKQLSSLLAPEGEEVKSLDSVYSEQCHERQKIGKGGKIRLVTVSTKSRPEYTTLSDSASAAGLTLEMVGSSTTYGRSGTKLELLSEYLADVPEEDFVIYVDAYETIVQQSRANIWRKFSQFCKPIVFGGLRKCYPDASMVMMYPNVSSAHVFRYLNDGQFMGNAGALKTMIDSVLEDIEQGATFLEPIKFRAGAEIAARWLSRYMFHNPEDIAIDSRGDLFFFIGRGNC